LEEKEDKHPTILHTEEKEIREEKPPNDKILYFKIADKNDKT